MSQEMTLDERSQALFNISIKSKEQLLAWLEQSGRSWLVLNSRDLVDALWGTGDAVAVLMQLLAVYRDYRLSQPTGEYRIAHDPMLGKQVQVPLWKDDTLTKPELDRCIRYLISEITQRDSSWSLESDPL